MFDFGGHNVKQQQQQYTNKQTFVANINKADKVEKRNLNFKSLI